MIPKAGVFVACLIVRGRARQRFEPVGVSLALLLGATPDPARVPDRRSPFTGVCSDKVNPWWAQGLREALETSGRALRRGRRPAPNKRPCRLRHVSPSQFQGSWVDGSINCT